MHSSLTGGTSSHEPIGMQVIMRGTSITADKIKVLLEELNQEFKSSFYFFCLRAAGDGTKLLLDVAKV